MFQITFVRTKCGRKVYRVEYQFCLEQVVSGLCKVGLRWFDTEQDYSSYKV